MFIKYCIFKYFPDRTSDIKIEIYDGGEVKFNDLDKQVPFSESSTCTVRRSGLLVIIEEIAGNLKTSFIIPNTSNLIAETFQKSTQV